MPMSAHMHHTYQEMLRRELDEEDYGEALRSLSLITYEETEPVFLPSRDIAILMLEEPLHRRLLDIWWHLVKPSD